jgi:flagellar biosynthetic protein FliR
MLIPGGLEWLSRTLLISIRLGAVLLLTPLLSATGVPPLVRVILVLALAASMSAFGTVARSAGPAPGFDQPGALLQAAATELALGLTLAVAIHIAFAAFAVAGRVIDIQIGFGLGQVLNPMSDVQLPVLATVYNQIAVIVFFAIDGHLAVMRGIAYSLERFPVGRPWPIEAGYGPIVGNVAGVFALALALMAPVAFCILLVEFALGVLSRNLPQINMLTLGIPIKIVVGLIALSLWFTGLGSAMNRVYVTIYQTWTAIFASGAADPVR